MVKAATIKTLAAPVSSVFTVDSIVSSSNRSGRPDNHSSKRPGTSWSLSHPPTSGNRSICESVSGSCSWNCWACSTGRGANTTVMSTTAPITPRATIATAMPRRMPNRRSIVPTSGSSARAMINPTAMRVIIVDDPRNTPSTAMTARIATTMAMKVSQSNRNLRAAPAISRSSSCRGDGPSSTGASASAMHA